MANVPYNAKHWTRVFRTDHGIMVARVTQKEPLTRDVNLTLEAATEPPDNIIQEVVEKIRFECGLDEKMKALRSARKDDIHLDLAIKNNPGFRLFSNSDIIEVAICSILSQNIDILEYVRVVQRFAKKYGEQVPWDKTLVAFPNRETIVNLSEDDWEIFDLGFTTDYLSNLNDQILSDIETYAYYPVYERGLDGLERIEGIGDFTSRIIMIYGVRRYELAFNDAIVQEILARKYNLNQVLPSTEFDKWIEEKWPNDPALIIHALIQDYMPAYIKDYDLDNFVEAN